MQRTPRQDWDEDEVRAPRPRTRVPEKEMWTGVAIGLIYGTILAMAIRAMEHSIDPPKRQSPAESPQRALK